MTICCIQTATCWAHLRLQTTVISGWNGYFNTLRVSSYTTLCRYTKLALRINLYLASTRITSGQGIILLLFVVVGIMSASALTFGLVSSRTLWWARPLTGWLTAHLYRNFLETVYWSCMKMGSRCAFSTTEFQHTIGKCRVVADRDKSCYSYGVTIVWCLDVLRHMTVTCKTTVFENTVFDFQFAACLAQMSNLQALYQNKEALYLDNWVVLRIVTLVWDIILVVLLKSKVKVSRDRPRWPKGFRVD